MEKNGKSAEEGKRREDGARKSSPKKRRKVNHACVYCRRSHMTCDLERPCTRCIKRNIGHLCHDEPREADTKKPKNGSVSKEEQQQDVSAEPAQATPSQSDMGRSSISSSMGPPMPFDGTRQRSTSGSAGFGAGPVMPQGNPLSLVQQPMQNTALNNSGSNNANQFSGFSEAWMTAQNFQDMNTFNPNYMITPEVTHEFNLLNDFLQTSLLDDSGSVPVGDEQGPQQQQQQQAAFSRTGQMDAALPAFSSRVDGTQGSNGTPAQSIQLGSMLPPPSFGAGRAISRPGSTAPGDKDKTSAYYLQAADPKGNDDPDSRMSQVLQAKYDAGLLKPFNYINGYSRLGKYLDGHIAASSKQKIIRTIGQFRPKFREKAQGLTDMQLLYVEMWFERQLMDYDRVFASMAVPACCWRRTGEIFRGNKEMAELIKVPVDRLRDGKIALHEILTEESTVRYWEEFGTIAFDPAHDTLLTACSLKNPSDTSEHPIVKCCFSFTIRRDEHKLPALIVGNFLPHDPPPQ